MGNSLHNKIYLGRTAGFASRRLRALLAVSALVSVGLLWMVFHSIK